MSVNGYPGKNAYFNGNNLAGITGFLLQKIDIHQFPKRNSNRYNLARTDGAKLVSAFYDTKPIVLQGTISRASQADMEGVRDTIISYVTGVNATLYTDYNGIARQWTNVAIDSIDFSDNLGGTIKVTLNFVANSPFGTDTAATTLMNTSGITASGGITAITPGGTAERQYPTITLTYASFSGGTATFTVTNTATTQAATYTGTITAADVFVLDPNTGIVTKNGTSVDFTGVIPYWAPAIGNFKYTDGGSSRSVTILIQNVKRWL